MSEKTLEMKREDLSRELDEIESEAIRINDKLLALRFCWDRKIKRLAALGIDSVRTFDNILR